MVEKTKVLEILEEIETKLNYREWKEAEKDIDYYIKNLEITVDKGINTLIGEYKKYLKKYLKHIDNISFICYNATTNLIF